MAQNDTTLQLPLPQMLDLALGTPEVGSVNFNILHNFLHILLHQTHLHNAKAEFRGDDANRIKAMVASLKDAPNFYLHESDIVDVDGNVVQRDYIPDSAVVTANVYGIDDQVPQKNEGIDKDPDKISMARVATDSKKIDETESIHESTGANLYDKIININNRLSELEVNFEYLNEDVANLHEFVHAPEDPEDQLPVTTEQTVITEVDEAPDTEKREFQDPIDDKKSDELRIDDENYGESRIDNMKIEELHIYYQNYEESRIGDKKSKKPQESDIKSSVRASRISHIKFPARASKVSGLATAASDINGISKQRKSSSYLGHVNDMKDEIESLKNDVMKVVQDVSEIRYHVDELIADKEAHKETATEKIETSAVIIDDIDDENISAGHVSSVISQTVDNIGPVIEEIEAISSTTTLPGSKTLAEEESDTDGDNSSIKHVSKSSVISKPDEGSAVPDPQEDKDAKNYQGRKSLDEVVQNFKTTYNEDMNKIDSRIKELEKKVKFDGFEGIEGFPDVVGNMKDIENDVERINNIIDQVNTERETREENMSILIEQIELLKTIKADREDLEDALADKADATVVNRKVSYNRFDSTCEQLAGALEDAILKLNKQEILWKEAVDIVQQEIDNKLDKTDIAPIQEVINERLQTLQDKLKKLSEQRRDREAAGTKKILKDVQCISCDDDVIMNMEHKALKYPLPMTQRKNIHPYLVYKLDEIRKYRQQFPPKHMNQFTAAAQEVNTYKFAADKGMEKSAKDHCCNRYCGGNHTITTPQQRVMRTGHFFAEWSPDIIPLSDGLVRGTDGQFYKSSPMPPRAIKRPEVSAMDQNISSDAGKVNATTNLQNNNHKNQ